MKDPDVAIAMDMHPDDFAPVASVHALGKSRPALDQAIRIGELGWSGVAGLLGLRRGSKYRNSNRASYKNKSRSTCK